MIEVRNNHSAFIRELLGDAYIDQLPPERFELRGWAGGYRITEWGEVIATFHGPHFSLAAGLLRNLKASPRQVVQPIRDEPTGTITPTRCR